MNEFSKWPEGVELEVAVAELPSDYFEPGPGIGIGPQYTRTEWLEACRELMADDEQRCKEMGNVPPEAIVQMVREHGSMGDWSAFGSTPKSDGSGS